VKSWEEKYLDDPLKGNSPTEEIPVSRPVGRFRDTYIAIGRIERTGSVSSDDVEDQQLAERLLRREQAWVPHLQWARRSVLSDYDSEPRDPSAPPALQYPAKVENAYTLLCENSMRPVAQVLQLRANSSAAAWHLLAREPLALHGALRPAEEPRPSIPAPPAASVAAAHWQLLRAEAQDDEEERLSADLRADPFLFLGLYGHGAGGSFSQSLEYHLRSNSDSSRVAYLAKLVAADSPSEGDPGPEEAAGLLVLLSGSSLREARRYLQGQEGQGQGQGQEGSPAFSESLLAPVNLQDVSGLHHYIPRTFGEKSQLDAVHFLDPEDLLLLGRDGPHADSWPLGDLPALPGHWDENAALLAQLTADGISYRYSRLDIEERLGEGMREKAEEWNRAMDKHQRTLLRIAALDSGGAVQGAGSVGAITTTAVAPPVPPLAVVASKAASKGAGGVLTADSNALLSSLLAVSEGDAELIL